jgi:acid phosphatase type 7
MRIRGQRFTRAFVLLLHAAGISSGQDQAPTLKGQPPNVGRAAEPYVLYDTRPIIVHGPYLVAPSETSAVIAWTTDTPCHSKVVYGIDQPTMEATSAKDGLLPVGTTHSVRILGLKPGQLYRYKAVSTRVVKLKGYWPDKGLSASSPVLSFRTFDARRRTATFYAMSDTHEDIARITALMKLADWKQADFLVHLGDAFHTLESEDQLFANWLDPLVQGIGATTPLIYARGNHDTRGPFARSLSSFVPIEEGRFYYTRDVGPIHLVVVDTAEDKPDITNVYAGLNAFGPYREQELAWLEHHTRSSPRLAEAPFRIAVMHQPGWGFVHGGSERWTDWANRSNINLVIAGHTHRFAHIKAGERNNNYPIVIVGQDQLAKVEATISQLKISLVSKDGSLVHSFVIERNAGTSAVPHSGNTRPNPAVQNGKGLKFQ